MKAGRNANFALQKLAPASTIGSCSWGWAGPFIWTDWGFDSLRFLRMDALLMRQFFFAVGGLQFSQLRWNFRVTPGVLFSCGRSIRISLFLVSALTDAAFAVLTVIVLFSCASLAFYLLQLRLQSFPVCGFVAECDFASLVCGFASFLSARFSLCTTIVSPV